LGTGGTISGIINSAQPHQKILGFPALKGDFLTEEIRKFATNDRWELIGDYNFGGYAKISNELVDFINRFFIETGISLDPIYTGKMVFGGKVGLKSLVYSIRKELLSKPQSVLS
jgi:1-aminocyclopropane-1-carboxylate deaminase